MADIKVEAELAGTVWKIEAGPGDEMAEGDALLILESMKMEIPVECPRAGRVVSIAVAEGDVVREGQLLAIVSTD